MASQTNTAESQKRTRQACENCRRKKVRCDGIRPECSFCSRLGQICHYAILDPHERRHRPSFRSHEAPNLGALYSRIARLETALAVSTANSASGATPADQASFATLSPTQSHATPYHEPPGLSPPRGQLQPGASGPADECTTLSALNIDPITMDKLLDIYFLNSHNQPYCFFHEPTFRQKVALGLVPDHLLSAVVASGMRFITDESLSGMDMRTAHALARNSWALSSQINLDGDDDCDLEVVQSTTLMSIFDYIQGRQRSAWVKLGLAARLAQALGLVSEPPPGLPFSEQEERRRTFWSVYLLDRMVTCGRARPQTFDESSCTVHLPCSEYAFRDGIPEVTQGLAVYTQSKELEPPEPSPLGRVVIVASVLSQCSQYAIQGTEADAKKPPWDAGSEFQKISSALLYLESQLHFQRPLREVLASYQTNSPIDAFSTEPIVVSYAMYHLCHCILNHFYLLRQRLAMCSMNPPQSFVRQAVQNNKSHAFDLSQALMDGLDMGCAVRGSFMGYSCLISAMLHAVNRHSVDPIVQEQSQKSLEFSMRFLQDGTRCWPNWANMYNALKEFVEIAANYKPLFDLVSTNVDIPEPFGEKMAYLTDYGSLSQAKKQDTKDTKAVTTVNDALYNGSNNILGILGTYQAGRNMAEPWPSADVDATMLDQQHWEGLMDFNTQADALDFFGA